MQFGDTGCMTVAAKEGKKEDQSIQVYPNPIANIVNVRWSHVSSIEKVKLIDLLGRTVLEQAISSTQISTSFETTALHAGVYWLEVLDRQDRVRYTSSRKVIKH